VCFSNVIAVTTAPHILVSALFVVSFGHASFGYIFYTFYIFDKVVAQWKHASFSVITYCNFIFNLDIRNAFLFLFSI